MEHETCRIEGEENKPWDSSDVVGGWPTIHRRASGVSILSQSSRQQRYPTSCRRRKPSCCYVTGRAWG